MSGGVCDFCGAIASDSACLGVGGNGYLVFFCSRECKEKLGRVVTKKDFDKIFPVAFPPSRPDSYSELVTNRCIYSLRKIWYAPEYEKTEKFKQGFTKEEKEVYEEQVATACAGALFTQTIN